MSRTNQIGVYVSNSDKSRLEREAEQADMTVSRYIMSFVQKEWNTEDAEEVAKQANVEERVERMTSNAADRIEEAIEQHQRRTEQMTDMAARSAVYSIANFELLKLTQKPPEAARTKSLQIGSRRLRDPFDPDADANADLAIETDDSADQAEQEAGSTGLADDFFKKHS